MELNGAGEAAKAAAVFSGTDNDSAGDAIVGVVGASVGCISATLKAVVGVGARVDVGSAASTVGMAADCCEVAFGSIVIKTYPTIIAPNESASVTSTVSLLIRSFFQKLIIEST